MACDVKWIKITTDMFDNRKIKHLRRLPDGNNIVLIWVMLLTMAGRCNAGGMIFLTENIPYTPKMLADELDFEENTVQLALKALENFNMIVCNNGYFAIAGWEEHQNEESLAKIREQNRLRKQRQRENQKLLDDMSRDSHVTQRDSHATDKEEDKEKDKEEEVLPKGNTKKKPVEHKYGEFQNVLLTDNEFENIANSFGIELRDKAIKFLDEYIEEKGYKSKSHNLAIRRWVIEAVSKEKPGQAQKANSSFNTDDFFNAASSRSFVSPRTAIEREAVTRMEAKTEAAPSAEVLRKAEELKQKLQGGETH